MRHAPDTVPGSRATDARPRTGESAQIIGKTYRQAAAAKFLILIAAATSVNALELGGLIELGTFELSLLWDSFDEYVWLSAMSPSSRGYRPQRPA